MRCLSVGSRSVAATTNRDPQTSDGIETGFLAQRVHLYERSLRHLFEGVCCRLATGVEVTSFSSRGPGSLLASTAQCTPARPVEKISLTPLAGRMCGTDTETLLNKRLRSPAPAKSFGFHLMFENEVRLDFRGPVFSLPPEVSLHYFRRPIATSHSKQALD